MCVIYVTCVCARVHAGVLFLDGVCGIVEWWGRGEVAL